MANVVVNKGDVIAPALSVAFEAVQHGGEELMRQTALGIVHKEHAQIVGAVGFQGTRCGVWHIAQLVSSLPDLFLGGLTYITVAVQRLTHGSHRNAASLCDVLDGCHEYHLPAGL